MLPFNFVRLPLKTVVLASLLGIAAAPNFASAGTGADFVLAGDDGYGVADCMKPGMECGRVIADAWCESHGHGHASAFGLAEDVTGTIKVSTAAAPKSQAPSVVIHCGE